MSGLRISFSHMLAITLDDMLHNTSCAIVVSRCFSPSDMLCRLAMLPSKLRRRTKNRLAVELDASILHGVPA